MRSIAISQNKNQIPLPMFHTFFFKHMTEWVGFGFGEPLSRFLACFSRRGSQCESVSQITPSFPKVLLIGVYQRNREAEELVLDL